MVREDSANTAKDSVDLLGTRIAQLSSSLDKLKLGAYFDLIDHPSRMLWLNFLAGLSRGVGMAIGFAFFSAAIVYALGRLVRLDLPLIGGFIADIVKIVQAQLGY